MTNKENLELLLREYGYPTDAIHRILHETEDVNFSEVKKRVMPYQDITTHRS